MTTDQTHTGTDLGHRAGPKNFPQPDAPIRRERRGSKPATTNVDIDPSWLLTVAQTARLLQIGRTRAYELVGRFEESGGASGIPVVRIGRAVRVPRDELVDWIRAGRVNGRADHAASASKSREPVRRSPVGGEGVAGRARSRRRRAGGSDPVQPPLFGAG